MRTPRTVGRRRPPTGSLWRSRWAAVGAAVAVTLGAGSIVAVNAASSAPSSFVSVDPTRILDTRTDVGLAGPFVSGVSQKLQVTGTVPTQPPGGAAPVSQEVVPSTATSAVFNVTVVRPQTKGFLSIRPGDASGTPATSNINFGPGGPNIANAVTVQLPASGTIDIYVNGTASEVLVDVAGYHLPATAGPAGPPGPPGEPGVDGVSPAQVVWVAKSDGDFTSLSAALASITDASAAKPYVIKIAPGVFTETAPVTLKDYVDVEGSGQNVTTLTCECGGTFPSPFVTAGAITSDLRHVTVENIATGASDYAAAIYTTGVVDGSFSLDHVTARATGGDVIIGVFNSSSSPSMNHVTAIATDANSFNTGVRNSSSSTIMNDLTTVASGGSTFNFGVSTEGATTITIRNSTIAEGIYNNGSTVNVAASSLGSAISVNSGVYACVGAHNSTFVALNNSCT